MFLWFENTLHNDLMSKDSTKYLGDVAMKMHSRG